MVKRVAIYSIPEGTDGDKFWKYHTKVHAPDVVRVAGPALKKYIINRVTKIISGKPQFFGLVEMWWESEESMNKAFQTFQTEKLTNGKTIFEDFWSQATSRFATEVEEFVAKE